MADRSLDRRIDAQKSVLPEPLQAREQPSDRHPLSSRAAEGQFAFLS
jgi:hypothetical protein